ncbi:hypothetical protein [Nocardioides sp. zg-1228]|uniref:hypothetical protein n=1 Tax=Nocardioides sp. zg-1228 TaxID=2763008 RepID=UPI0016424533|nr:hypothetical protein [Nocardioides sp. zg-1228]MBC2935043.1 hypothetical protein [Nocardioides sp. zg-1228]QSF59000.1 hypothetical protein JX575_07485 [Nocardioides sp. zg-1228]
MTHRSTARPTVPSGALRSLATALAGVALLAGSLASAPAHARPAPAEPAERAAARTTLTFTVDDCEGCEIQLVNARRTLDVVVHVWQSRTRKVRDGSVTFRVAARRTWGMSATVVAPWEGQTGYLTTVAWRYNGKRVGDPVTVEEAVTKRRASACWEGVRSRRVIVPLVVEKVWVDGVRKKVNGSIAFVPTTQSWLAPMREVWDGVLGSQDVNICG